MPLKLIEYNLKIYLMSFELKKNNVLTDFHFVVFTRDNFLYLQFIRLMFCSDLCETLNNEIYFWWVQRKTVKAKINEALLRIVLIEDSFNKVSSEAKTSV